MIIVLDAEKMTTRSKAHPYLKEMLHFPDYYGNNLDALYDCLTDLGPTQIWFENEEKGGDFFRKILRVFKDAHRGNADLVILDQKPQTQAASAEEAPEVPQKETDAAGAGTEDTTEAAAAGPEDTTEAAEDPEEETDAKV